MKFIHYVVLWAANASSQITLVSDAQTGLMDDGVKTTLLGLWMGLFVIFAGRKFTQPIKVVLIQSLEIGKASM